VGVPNISFDEIRGLRVPRLPTDRQEKVERRYRREVLPWHRKAVARHAELRQTGGSARGDRDLQRLREVGERRWQAAIDELDSDLLGESASQ
jgi:hypothetical protein